MRNISNNANLRQIYRVFLLICSTAGLYFGLAPDRWYKLTFYTLQSNVLVFLMFLFLVISGLRGNESSKTTLRLKACVTINITLTFVVYALLLAPNSSPEDFYTLSNLFLHYLVPVLAILDWFIFDKAGNYEKYDPFLWFIFPTAYCIFALIKGAVFRVPIPDIADSPYPYFFLNVDKYGWLFFVRYFLMIMVVYILIGYLVLFIKRGNKKNS